MKKIQTKNPWLITYANPDAPIRLFCFPYAGGSATIFRTWGEYIPTDIEICAIQLPGRGSRMREASYTHIKDLLPELKSALGGYLTEKPSIFYGHSMGALIAFELAHLVSGEMDLLHLIISGHRAPQLHSDLEPLYHLPDAQFLAAIKNLNGMAPQILENKELMNLLIPIIRADFTLCDTYEYDPKPPLTVDLTVLGGMHDPRATEAQLHRWEELTRGHFDLNMLPGDHFFLHSHEAIFFDVLNRRLSNLI